MGIHMAVYAIMVLLTTAFAYLSTRYKECYTIKINKHAKLVTINQSNIFAFLSFLPIVTVSALRYQVGVDYNSYMWMHEAVVRGEPIHAEVGYKFLSKLVLLYAKDTQAIFVVTSIIILALICYGIYKYSPQPALSLFLFVSMGYLFSSFNILRQYIAIAIIFVGLRFIKENKFLPFLLLIIIAMTFHKTAIIMIPLFFILQFRFKQSYMFIMALIGACFIVLRGPLTNILVTLFYPQYAGTDLIKPLTPFEFLYYAIVFSLLILLCFAYKSGFFSDKLNLILFNCVFFSLLMYLCLSFVPEINRIAIYLEIFVIILIPRLFAAEQNVKTRRLYYGVTVFFFIAFFIVSVGVMGRFEVLPYQTVFSRL